MIEIISYITNVDVDIEVISNNVTVEVSTVSGLQLGETSTTAYRGDRGKIAYDHSQIISGNPHGTTATDIGLGNVDNTSDADKPISDATQTLLDEKVDKEIGKGLSTNDYTDLEKTKLAGIEAGATQNETDSFLLNRTNHTGVQAISTVSGLQDAIDLKLDKNTAITGATKTKITYDSDGLITSGADATTADIADSINKRYVSDAQLTILGNTSGTNTGDNAANTTANAYADAKVADAINNGVTTIAPSQNAVFDALALKENTITAGTTGQYYRGDKTFQTLDKTAVGLGNVDNTSDVNKPISTATQTALDLKANLESPNFTGVPTAPTALAGTTTTQVATTQFANNNSIINAIIFG